MMHLTLCTKSKVRNKSMTDVIRVGVVVTHDNIQEEFYINALTRPDVTHQKNVSLVSEICDAWINLDESKKNEYHYWNIRATERKGRIAVGIIVNIGTDTYYIDRNFKWNKENDLIKMTKVHKVKCNHKCNHAKGSKICIGCNNIISANVLVFEIDKYKIFIGIDTQGNFYTECELV